MAKKNLFLIFFLKERIQGEIVRMQDVTIDWSSTLYTGLSLFQKLFWLQPINIIMSFDYLYLLKRVSFFSGENFRGFGKSACSFLVEEHVGWVWGS